MNKIFKNLFFLFLFLLLMFNTVFSQGREYIVGKLLDASTQEPIAFASIRIKDRALGIISNADGSFKIPIRYKELGDIIEISSMGYQSIETIIHDLSRDEINIVKLQPALVELQEVVIRGKRGRRKYISTRNIVRKAVKSIVDNYSFEPFSTIGYYRDYQLKDNIYLNLNEAILEVFDPGFAFFDEEHSKVSIYDYKHNLDFETDSLSAKNYDYKYYRKVIPNGFLPNYGGNEFTVLRVHDAIRNYKVDSYSFVHRLDSDLLKEHVFRKEDDTYLGDELLYTIRFTKKVKGYIAYGRLFISKYNYAIYKMEYAVYDSTKKSDTGIEDKNGTKKRLIFEVITEYRRKDSKMFLNYISFHNSFQLTRPPDFIVNEVIANVQCKCFEVRFSKGIDATSAGLKKNYKFKFKGRKIKFKEFVIFDKAVRLYPDLPLIELGEMFDELVSVSGKKAEGEKILEVDIRGLRTAEGANPTVLYEKRHFNYQQFREFFVQQIKTPALVPKDTLFMDKKKPIFKNQPIVKPESFNAYWMNTPLQNSRN